MGYIRADKILPSELVALLQEYAPGQMLYIPKKKEMKSGWGMISGTREELKDRNAQIYAQYLTGTPTNELAEKYFLTPKSIQRIIRQKKREL